MTVNPFDDEDATFYALVNDEGQYSLWPEFAKIPDGWTIAHGKDNRGECLKYIEENWQDMRPRSLIREMRGKTGVNGGQS
jgi:MbtH protein